MCSIGTSIDTVVLKKNAKKVTPQISTQLGPYQYRLSVYTLLFNWQNNNYHITIYLWYVFLISPFKRMVFRSEGIVIFNFHQLTFSLSLMGCSNPLQIQPYNTYNYQVITPSLLITFTMNYMDGNYNYDKIIQKRD